MFKSEGIQVIPSKHTMSVKISETKVKAWQEWSMMAVEIIGRY